MEYQKVPSAPFPKKLSNSHSFGGTSIYDGVFSGPMKVASFVEEDYGAIFGSSRSSSIPVLDVPELNESEVTADLKSSKLDYSMIFGGFGEFDFTISHEELSAKSSKRDGSVKDTRTVTGSHSSNFSVENQVLPREAFNQSFDGVKEFKMSYHKANQERRNGTNGTTHVTQLHAVPGYSCLIDEFAPLQVTKGDRPLSSELNSTPLNGSFSGEIREGKHSRNASSVFSPGGGASNQGSRDSVKFPKEYKHNRSISNDMLFDAYETGPRTQPSKAPLPSSRSDSFSKNRGDAKTSTGSKIGVSKSSSSEDATGFSSPPYFEEEVDRNSVAAASAAALKKAIEEAQVRLKIAKEIMERKKDGLRNHVKLRFNDGLRTEESREGKYTDKTNKFRKEEQQKCRKDDDLSNDGLRTEESREGKYTDKTIKIREEVQQQCRNDDDLLQVFSGIGTQTEIKAGEKAPDTQEMVRPFFPEESPVGTQGGENNSALMDHRKEEVKDLKAGKGEGIETKMVESVNDFELKERIVGVKMFGHPYENANKLKEIEEPHKQEVERKLKAAQGAYELKESTLEQKSGQGVCDQDESDKKSRVVGLEEEKAATFKASHEVEAREKKQRKQWELNTNEPKLKMQLEEIEECGKTSGDQEEYGKSRNQEECGIQSIVAVQPEKNEVTLEAFLGVENREKKQRRLWAPNANECKLVMQELKDSERMKMRLLNDERVGLENEAQKEVPEKNETEIISEDVPEEEENEAALTETFYHEDNGKTSEASCDRVEFENQQKEDCRSKVNEDVSGKADAESTSDEALDQEVEVSINEFHDGEKSGKKLEVDVGLGAKERLAETEENEQILKRAYQIEEIEKKLIETCEWRETGNNQTEIDQCEDDVNIKVVQEACKHFRNNLEAANGIDQQDTIEVSSKALEAAVHDANNEYLEVPSDEENGGFMEATKASSECQERETEDEIDFANDPEEERIFEDETADRAQFLELDEAEEQVKYTPEAQASKINGLNTGVPDTDVWQKPSYQHDKEFNTICNAGHGGEELGSELEENFEDADVEGAMNLDEDESNSESSSEERWVGNGEKVEATQLLNVFQGKGESSEITHDIKTSQNKEHYEEDYSKALKTEGMEAEGTMQKEVMLPKEHVEKIDLAKEKERERELERIAVERAIREARERAFTEARAKAERAAVEKANAEARKRAMAEARERSGKASGEVNHKSSADKTSAEVRLKAERAAVERATAEARMRALEKAMSEKAASKARNQALKSSGPSRDNKHSSASNDSLSKGSGATKYSGPSKSSNHDDKFDGINGEPDQRHKARVESHHRIAERTAKALAEKNMRDLLAQKEQAERNRLAEALDAEVKRWSQGKAGNLRALLSTLQYILGPDSGWHPIPLTDLVPTAAVKKAYRKATLLVHPDKLQQRGASIQQKYTCEKVFDLLKEAWNRFNPEER